MGLYDREEISGADLDAVGIFEVDLMSVGNPDFGQDPTRPVFGVRSRCVRANSLRDASRLCREFIEENSLGGGNWSGGAVRRGGMQIAEISYNGRVWRDRQAELAHDVSGGASKAADGYRARIVNGDFFTETDAQGRETVSFENLKDAVADADDFLRNTEAAFQKGALSAPYESDEIEIVGPDGEIIGLPEAQHRIADAPGMKG